jgi:hypothetical protein
MSSRLLTEGASPMATTVSCFIDLKALSAFPARVILLVHAPILCEDFMKQHFQVVVHRKCDRLRDATAMSQKQKRDNNAEV